MNLKELKSFTDKEKIEKFDKLFKNTRKIIKTVVNESYGYNNLETYIFEDTLEVLFGRKIFKIISEDNRGLFKIK